MTTGVATALQSVTFTSLYRDSVTLMMIASQLQQLPGVERAGVVMATPANLAILDAAGMLPAGVAASPDDLLVVVRAMEQASADTAIAFATDHISGVGQAEASQAEQSRPATVLEGMQVMPAANLLAVSTPGAYAPLLVKQGLEAGLNVFCFSDNVSLQDEVALKRLAASRQLLLMGPDCGTALIDGSPLGFVNAVSPGPVGIVSASGTGAQEVMCQLDALGVGISQAIGVGGRDLSAEVGATMTFAALDALASDEQTTCIVLIGKPPAPAVARALLAYLADFTKPVVMCLIGGGAQLATGPVTTAPTLADAAVAAARIVGMAIPASIPREPAVGAVTATRVLLGLYTGGTLASEAKYLLRQQGIEAEILDLGDDQYTVGRPHPMIDPSQRSERLVQAGGNPEVGVVLVDLVLGFGAAVDPATPLADAARAAKAHAIADGRVLAVVASVCGTAGDPQSLDMQRQALIDAGVIVAQSNAAAVDIAAQLLKAGA
ncbi:MAG: acyl-CoA synthetase FdrA [Candidatus Nanopelagicales bacterium]